MNDLKKDYGTVTVREPTQQQIDEGTAAAYRRGYAAYQIGNREFDNPYECGDDRGAAWRDGMRDARSDSSFHNRENDRLRIR